MRPLPRRPRRPHRPAGQLSELAADAAAWALDYAWAVRWQAAGLLRRADPHAFRRRTPGRPSVVLVPGIWERWTFLLPVARVLHEHGWDVVPVPGLAHNSGTIEEMARVVDDHVRREGLERCVLVAHSKGGLIGKQLLAHHNEATTIRGLVAVNTPFTGSALARLLPLPALRVFLPRSPELTALAASRHVDRHIVSVHGRFDPHIPGGSHLEGARNVRLGTRGHFRPLGDPRVHAVILAALEDLAAPRDPQGADEPEAC